VTAMVAVVVAVVTVMVVVVEVVVTVMVVVAEMVVATDMTAVVAEEATKEAVIGTAVVVVEDEVAVEVAEVVVAFVEEEEGVTKHLEQTPPDQLVQSASPYFLSPPVRPTRSLRDILLLT